MLKRALEDQRAAKDNHVGPGHYEPNMAFTMRKSPSARFTTAALAEGPKGPIDGLAEIVSGTGNMAERVNAARGKIQEYLGQGPTASQPRDPMGKGNQSSGVHLQLGKDSLPSNTKAGGNYSRSVTNKQANKISLSGAGGAGGSTVAPGPGGGAVTSPNNRDGASPQPSASFLSGVKRTDLAK